MRTQYLHLLQNFSFHVTIPQKILFVYYDLLESLIILHFHHFVYIVRKYRD